MDFGLDKFGEKLAALLAAFHRAGVSYLERNDAWWDSTKLYRVMNYRPNISIPRRSRP